MYIYALLYPSCTWGSLFTHMQSPPHPPRNAGYLLTPVNPHPDHDRYLTCLLPSVSKMEKMYSARSSGEACTIMYTEMEKSKRPPAGTPLVALAKHAFASSPAFPLRLVRPRLNRRRRRYFKLFLLEGGGRREGVEPELRLAVLTNSGVPPDSVFASDIYCFNPVACVVRGPHQQRAVPEDESLKEWSAPSLCITTD